MEFILVIPVVVLVLVAALQVVAVARVKLELMAAVRDGVRVAATTPDPARAVEAVSAALPPSLIPATRISVERPARVGALARVSAVARYPLGAPFPPSFAVDVSARAVMRTER